jgi:hypothetical protein
MPTSIIPARAGSVSFVVKSGDPQMLQNERAKVAPLSVALLWYVLMLSWPCSMWKFCGQGKEVSVFGGTALSPGLDSRGR